MRLSTSTGAALLAVLPLLLAAPTCNPTPPPSLQWYYTCGDPVCHGYQGPFQGVDACTDQQAGATCDTEGAQCDPQDSCDALLECASSDPTQQPGGCPISRRAYKKDIHYLDPKEEQRAADDLLKMKLATWRYKWDGEAHKPHLGFIIDDVGNGPEVDAEGQHVDLYGYTSLAVATIQAQQKEIDALEKRVEKLEKSQAKGTCIGK